MSAESKQQSLKRSSEADLDTQEMEDKIKKSKGNLLINAKVWNEENLIYIKINAVTF